MFITLLKNTHVFDKNRRWQYGLLLVILFTIGTIYKLAELLAKERILRYDYYDTVMSFPSRTGIGNGSGEQSGAACPIPQLNPFDKSIQHLLEKKPPPINCETKYSLLFKSTLDSRIIPEGGPEHIRKEGWASCCYRTVERNEQADNPDFAREIVSEECFPLSITEETKIPEAHEFIAIFCQKKGSKDLVPVDFHAFVPLKANVSKPGIAKNTTNNMDRLNVVIFGLDAVSRMNFLRTMPQSYSFLKKELDAVEMTGYNKVGEETFPNIIPMLTSKPVSELRHCLHYVRSYDGCPFIWKRFSELGYSTSLNGDAPAMDIFYYGKPGFHLQPTDYYLRPLARWADKHVGSQIVFNSHLCYGPRLSFQFLLDSMQKYVYRMEESNKNFFQFSWSSALSHDSQAAGLLGDPHLLQSLSWLKGSGYLNNTLLILMSDHGFRLGNYRNSIQGQLEDRLPFLFFVFPEQFKKKYSRAYRNIRSNWDKLMTTFDIHETLQDILDLESIQEASLKRREKATSIAKNSSSLPRGLSLFLPIPESRTCKMAGIERNFCSCNFMRTIPLHSPILQNVKKAAVSRINALLKDHPECAQLRVHNVTLAQQTGRTSSDFEAYIVNFVTEPGKAEFEAMVVAREGMIEGKSKKIKFRSGELTVQGKIARTNWYGNQSRCVRESGIKQYCFCSD